MVEADTGYRLMTFKVKQNADLLQVYVAPTTSLTAKGKELHPADHAALWNFCSTNRDVLKCKFISCFSEGTFVITLAERSENMKTLFLR